MAKTTSATVLVQAVYAPGSATTVYTVPSSTVAIIDKFTATNTHSSAIDLSVFFVPSGQSNDAEYTVIDAHSIPDDGTTTDFIGGCVPFDQLKGHMLEAGDKIQVTAGTADKVVIYVSGRQVVTS